MTTTDVDNWPADADGVQGPELMERFQQHAERFETEIVFDHIHTAKLGERPFRLVGRQATYTCDALIIATGASARYLGLPSEQAFMGKGVSACATCDGFFYKGQDVVGRRRRQHRGRGGALPVEHREARDRRASPRQVPRRSDPGRQPDGEDQRRRQRAASSGITRSTKCWATTAASPACASKHKTTARRATCRCRACSSRSATRRTRRSSKASSTWSTATSVKSGTQGNATATSVPGVFAAGDVADHVYRQAVTSAGTGCMAALDAEAYLEDVAA